MSIVVRTLADQTYEIVRRQILQGIIAPGTPVRQDNIALELGISKIPLREALGRLEQDGLLSSYPNRGYVVRPLSAAEANEVFLLRLKLEPAATAEASLVATKEHRKVAQAELVALESDQDKAGADYLTRNRTFHLSLIKPGGPVVYQLIERLQILSERYVRLHLEPRGRTARAREEHRAILDAWLAGDQAKIEKKVAAHIQGSLTDLQQQLEG